MTLRLDHVVIWVADPLRSLEFFVDVVGLTGERVAEFRDGKVPFPSVRVSEDTLVDLMPQAMATALNGMGKSLSPLVAGSAGQRVHHVCLAMSRADYEALRARLAERGASTFKMERSFGARGVAPEAFYFHDPDGNVFEARYYE
jgi:catechol 2,3-dioxygenase-like lactoylglutathione lyase family enzyme